MFVIANRPTVGYCYYCKIGKKRILLLLENRQETGYCYFLKIGKKRDTVLLENRQETVINRQKQRNK